jgi:hypothetical protein
MSDRIIELALEALEARKTALDAEITALRAGLKPGRGRAQSSDSRAERPVRRRAPRSAAARKAQSERMKEYWARRRGEGTSKAATGRKARS